MHESSPYKATELGLPLPHPVGHTATDDVFEHYRIFRREDGSLWELGRGAMGVTYKATDTNLGKPVALKIINTQLLGQSNTQKRFRREARAAASLHQRNIAAVYHLGESGGSFFYAMEFVDGETVEALVKREGPLPWGRAFAVALQITRALMAAHARNLVHRDIKPANIMLVDEVDEQGVAKLIDFGLAKSAVEENTGSNVVTNASGFLGTPLYASPEQCEEVPADIRSDIYSLGITLWFMLTGHPPFQGNLAKVFHQQIHVPPSLEQLPVNMPTIARALVEKMLAKDRDDRPQTPAELRGEIETCLQVSENKSGDLVAPLSGAPAKREQMPLVPVETIPLTSLKKAVTPGTGGAGHASPLEGQSHRKRMPVVYFLASGCAAMALLVGVLLGVKAMIHSSEAVHKGTEQNVAKATETISTAPAQSVLSTALTSPTPTSELTHLPVRPSSLVEGTPSLPTLPTTSMEPVYTPRETVGVVGTSHAPIQEDQQAGRQKIIPGGKKPARLEPNPKKSTPTSTPSYYSG